MDTDDANDNNDEDDSDQPNNVTLAASWNHSDWSVGLVTPYGLLGANQAQFDHLRNIMFAYLNTLAWGGLNKFAPAHMDARDAAIGTAIGLAAGGEVTGGDEALGIEEFGSLFN